MASLWWPVLGRMHVADGERQHRQPERDLGPHSQAIKGPREYHCAPLSKSPQLFTKGWPAQKNIAAKWWRRLQQLPPLLCAKRRQHNHCAAPDFPSFVQTMWLRPKDFLYFYLFQAFSSFGKERGGARGSLGSHGTICIAPIIPENLLLHAYIVGLKNATILSNKAAA